MQGIFRMVQDCLLWCNHEASNVINTSMFMPELLRKTTTHNWKTIFKLVCLQLDPNATVFVLEESGEISGCESMNQSSSDTVFWLLKRGDSVFPLVASDLKTSLPSVVIENVGTFAVSISASWNGSVNGNTVFANHVDLLSLFSALRVLDLYHVKSSPLYEKSRWPRCGSLLSQWRGKTYGCPFPHTA